jgi:acetyl esterase
MTQISEPTKPSQVMPELAPELVDMARRWKEAGVPDLYLGAEGPSGGPVSRERARNIRAFLYPKPVLPTGRIDSKTIDGPHGPIPIRIYWPHSTSGDTKTIATVVFFHGGGWVLGDLDSHEAHAIRIANRTGAVVASVDYRLAPESTFPQAIDDAFAATQWAFANRASLGGTNAPVALSGDSAGGNLAAAAALLCRDAGLQLKAQLLIYPAVLLVGKPGPENIYLGSDAQKKGLDPRASPLLAPSLKGVAPAVIGVGRYDFLYQDNLAYAAKLEQDGVNVILRDFPTLNHGFFSFTAVSNDSEVASNQLCDDLKAMLER